MLIVDAQLSPHLAIWIQNTFSIEAYSVSFLNKKTASDEEIFSFAKEKSAIILTKDSDFVTLLERLGSPPKLIWITCGNTSNVKMKEILASKFYELMDVLESSDLVELSD